MDATITTFTDGDSWNRGRSQGLEEARSARLKEVTATISSTFSVASVQGVRVISSWLPRLPEWLMIWPAISAA